MGHPSYKGCLLAGLLVEGLSGLSLLGVQEGAEPAQCLVANDKNGSQCGLSGGDKTGLLILLVLRVVDLEDVVLALETLVVGQENQFLGLTVELIGGLLDDREALVDTIEGLVTDRVGLLDIRRDVLVGLSQPGNDWGSKSLISGVTELNRLLAELVCSESVNTVADDGIVQKMLKKVHG